MLRLVSIISYKIKSWTALHDRLLSVGTDNNFSGTAFSSSWIAERNYLYQKIYNLIIISNSLNNKKNLMTSLINNALLINLLCIKQVICTSHWHATSTSFNLYQPFIEKGKGGSNCGQKIIPIAAMMSNVYDIWDR